MTLYVITAKFFVGVGTAFGAFSMPFSGRTARDERPHSFRAARHHGAGRL